MNKFKPTPEQELAINSKGEVLVSAAAGSGKTALLVNKVIKEITDEQNPVDINRLLIVTFTKATAYELKAKILKEINEKLDENPDNENLLRQKMLLNLADIGTTDSVCLKLVKNHFHELGIEPNFEIIDETSAKTLLNKIIDDVFLKYYENENPDFIAMLNAFDGIYSDKDAKKVIFDFYFSLSNVAFKNEYLDKLNTFFEDKNGKNWFKIINNYFAEKFAEYKKQIEKSFSYFASLQNFGLFGDMYLELQRNLEEAIKILSDDTKSYFDIQDYLSKLSNFKYSRAIKSPELKNEIYEANTSFIKKIKELFQKDIETLNGYYLFDESSLNNVLTVSQKIVKILTEIVYKVDENYYNALLEKGKLTFNYVARLALSLLVKYENGEIIKQKYYNDIISQYDEILVDEYQDTDDLQDVFYKYISVEGKKLVAVGDLKQSIYGFRGGNPQNFKNKQNTFVMLKNDNLFENIPRKIYLNKNFRSRKEICEFVNTVFYKIMSKDVGGNDYGEAERLTPQKDFPKTNKSEAKRS